MTKVPMKLLLECRLCVCRPGDAERGQASQFLACGDGRERRRCGRGDKFLTEKEAAVSFHLADGAVFLPVPFRNGWLPLADTHLRFPSEVSSLRSSCSIQWGALGIAARHSMGLGATEVSPNLSCDHLVEVYLRELLKQNIMLLDNTSDDC